MNRLQRLYNSEINFMIECFFDEGIDWYLGDGMNGFKAEGNRDTLDEAIEQLWQAAKKHYPDAKCFKESEGPVLGTQPTPIRRF